MYNHWKECIDWKKYPPLPEAPAFPQWRDTPKREAYFRELQEMDKKTKDCCAVFFISGIAVFIGLLVKMASRSIAGDIVLVCGLSLFLLGMSWRNVCKLFWRVKLALKYHIFPIKLKRPKISGAVTAIMIPRPRFDETEFRRYWASDEHADIALSIREWAMKHWAIPGKMLYPNDSVMLLFAHRKIGDAKDYEKHFLVDPEYFFDYDNTLAEIVELCFAVNSSDCSLRTMFCSRCENNL